MSGSIPDIFDSSLDLEREHLDRGYAEGLRDGQAEGLKEGREVGLKSGFEIGEEVGFYSGCIEIWVQALEEDATLFSARGRKSIQTFRQQLTAFPLKDPQNQDYDGLLKQLRTRWKLLTSLLGAAPLEYPGYPHTEEDPTSF